MTTKGLRIRAGTVGWLLFGTAAGLVAGAAFIVFEMVAAHYGGRPASAPVRLIAAIGLGKEALPGPPKIGTGTVLAAGYVIHFGLSMIFGAIFGAIASLVGPLRSNRTVLIGAAAVYGLLLWLVNFYVFGNLFWPWFTGANPFLQFVAHGFFFGAILGLLLVGALQEGEGGRRALSFGRIAVWNGVVLLAVIGVIHLVEAPEHFEAFAYYVGVLFVANMGGAFVAISGIARNSSLWGWLTGLAVAGGTFMGYLVSRTVGLPFSSGSFVSVWATGLGILSLIVEFLFVVMFLVALAAREVRTGKPSAKIAGE